MSIFSNRGRRSRPVRKRSCAAVIVAAGASSRMGGDKLMLLVGGQPVVAHTLRAFENAPEIDKIVIVTRPESVVLMQDICREFGISKACEIVAGGETRSHSALNGVLAAGAVELVAIHDGARPLVPLDVISRTFAAASKHGAAAPGVEVNDTVKTVQNGVVADTPDRAALRAIQTPQIFDTAIIKGALTRAVEQRTVFTDDCAAVEALGMSVHVVDGSRENIKITTPIDLAVAEAILRARLEAAL